VRRILGSSSCPKPCAPAPHSGFNFVPEKWRACAEFWARFRARKVDRLRRILGSISCPKSGLDFVPEMWHMYGVIIAGRKTGTKSCPLFGHEIEPRMWRRLPTFRSRNPAQNAASAGCLCDPLRGRQLAHVFDGRGERGCVGGSAGSVKAARASTSTSRNTSPTTALSASTIFGAQPCWPPAAATFGR
jgi:hypothetical protein